MRDPLEGQDLPDNYLCSWDELPEAVRQQVGPEIPPGHHVFRCQSRDKGGRLAVEWVWLDEHHAPIDAFWLES